MRPIRARAACLALAVTLAAALAACTGGTAGGPITVLVPWAFGTAEYNAFQAVIKDFDKAHPGIQVSAKSTRALTQQLNADLNAGDPPDIADLPDPSAVDDYHADRSLVSTHIDLSDYAQPWRSLAEPAGSVLAVPVKADIDSLLWYARTDASPPLNWTDLTSLSAHGTPWCLGLASGPTSGWPGADWVADILLSMTSADDYKKWLSGSLHWTDPLVRAAWHQWGTFLRNGSSVAGGTPAALDDSFSGPFSGKCQLRHGALSAIGLTPTNVADYNYVQFPSASSKPSSPVMVSGDFMALFTTNPNAKTFLTYLATAGAQEVWVSQPGFALSANKAVSLRFYQYTVQQRLAKLIQHPSTTLCFTASDLMTPDLSAAFFQAVLDYVNNPATLPSSLAGLDSTEEGAGPSPDSQNACSAP